MKTITNKTELTNIGFELFHPNGKGTWYVMKDGKAFAGFTTKKVAVQAIENYKTW